MEKLSKLTYQVSSLVKSKVLIRTQVDLPTPPSATSSHPVTMRSCLDNFEYSFIHLWLCQTFITACGILVPQTGIKSMSPALECRFLTTGPLDNFKGMDTGCLSGTSLAILGVLIHLTLPSVSEVSVSLAHLPKEQIVCREIRQSKWGAEPGIKAEALSSHLSLPPLFSSI